MIVGLITSRDVLLHPSSIVRGFGIRRARKRSPMLRSGRRSFGGVAGVLFATLLGTAAPAMAVDPGFEVPPARVDCRYSAIPSTAEKPGSREGVLLPDGDVFRPLLADQREPRFYADYMRVDLEGSSDVLSEGHGEHFNAALVAFGGSFGIWGLRQPHGCDGLQVSLFGVVFSQFNLDTSSFDLINSDYLVGPQVTLRWGRWSGRVRFYHQSSHLGDEFLLNYGVEHGVQRQDLSFEIVDALLSVEDEWWRLYGGGGLVVLSGNDPDLKEEPGLVQWGLELRGPGWRLMNTQLRLVSGASFSSVQATDWEVNTSVNGGLEWAAPGGGNRARLLLAYNNGAVPFSQFFFMRSEIFGVQLQFEF